MVKRINVTVTDPVGLYATPATELVDRVKAFNSDIKLVYASKTVNMKSLMGVLSLGIPTKAKIEIIADGEDEEAAIDKVTKLMKELNYGKGYQYAQLGLCPFYFAYYLIIWYSKGEFKKRGI